MVNKKPTDGAGIAPVVEETETVTVIQASTANVPLYTAPAPRRKTVERQGARSEPYVRHWPQVRGGICEFCGVLDSNVPAEKQYQLCGHYRNMELRCSYCDESKNPDEITYHSILNIVEHPDNPDKFIVCCDSYTCSEKHLARFQRNR